nr:tyrosinase [Danio rerio]
MSLHLLLFFFLQLFSSSLQQFPRVCSPRWAWECVG